MTEDRRQQAAGLSVISYSLSGKFTAMSCRDDLKDFYGFYAFYDFYDFYDVPLTAYCAKRPEPVEGLTAYYYLNNNTRNIPRREKTSSGSLWPSNICLATPRTAELRAAFVMRRLANDVK